MKLVANGHFLGADLIFENEERLSGGEVEEVLLYEKDCFNRLILMELDEALQTLASVDEFGHLDLVDLLLLPDLFLDQNQVPCVF